MKPIGWIRPPTDHHGLPNPYVAEALNRVFEGEMTYQRFPRALWHLQDLYAVGTEPWEEPLSLEPWPRRLFGDMPPGPCPEALLRGLGRDSGAVL